MIWICMKLLKSPFFLISPILSFLNRIIEKNLPSAGTSKVLFGNTKVFMRVDIANILDNMLNEKVLYLPISLPF